MNKLFFSSENRKTFTESDKTYHLTRFFSQEANNSERKKIQELLEIKKKSKMIFVILEQRVYILHKLVKYKDEENNHIYVKCNCNLPPDRNCGMYKGLAVIVASIKTLQMWMVAQTCLRRSLICNKWKKRAK